MRVFIDSNVPMYVAGRPHPLREPARLFMARVRSGEVQACTSTEVLQEVLYRYIGLRRPDLARAVYDLFVQICPEILPVTLADTDLARDLACGRRGLGVRDAIHAAVMMNNGVVHIATFDTAFDRVSGIDRLRLT